MNGLELQSHLAGEGCRNPIIFITVYDNKELRGWAVRAGAAAFLRKPFDDEGLFRTIRSALRNEINEIKVPNLISVVDDDPSVRMGK